MSKNIIITGTSRGIGFEMVKIFSGMGHNVLALSRNSNPVDILELKGVTSFSFDLSKEDDFEKVNHFVSENWSHVDVLINNAGALVNKPFSETSMKDFERVYATNVFGVAKMIQTVIPFMKPKAHIVTISSMGGVQGSMKFAGLSAYSSSKGAVITLIELLAEEYKDSGISFNVLALGAVQTEMLQEAFPGYQAPITAMEMADYIVEFSLNSNKFYNGKLLQVSNSTP
ncbi:SDR family oxidoreductase [Mangrovimonas sp. AS39]|uniref:SDR family NAD(P)-dependent oxidoreductase n=1 Tax=Mangrovimonas TaxID=1211036 RepID=UPI00142329FE|nr:MULTISPECIES: SDR family oxidoreductase [Mangrovimonas]MCF1191461.1 SDR family oxidoreductase [Mangrovimonas futianensis]MCF1195156.1 SDR family oxidoreductase [Mangrovimonas futianensis]NIK92302.1 SDR family oxidoreductase [Mangrovimonas sp. CR14]